MIRSSLYMVGLGGGMVIGARRVVRSICRLQSKRCDVPLPLLELKRGVVLSQLAYKSREDVVATIDTYENRACVDDLCSKITADGGFPVFFDGQPIEHAQAFAWRNKKSLYVAFRGTENKRDALADIDVRSEEVEELARGIKVHKGFYKQFMSVDDSINALVRKQIDDVEEIVFCGHSLGGALATLAAAFYAVRYPQVAVKCVSCGSPRVGNNEFCAWFGRWVRESYRLFNENDPVAMVPMSHRFSHVEGGICFHDDGDMRLVPNDTFWLWRPFVSIAYFDLLRPISDHDCALYIQRIPTTQIHGE